MSKRALFMLFVIALAFTVISCSKKAVPADPPPEGEIAELAAEFVAKLSQEDFAGAVSYFDPTMKTALPENKLAEIWQSLLTQAGPFVSQVETREESVQGYDAVFVTTEFEKAKIDIRVVFDKNKRVAGLFFHPVQDNLESNYTPPPYAFTASFTEREVTVGSGEWALPGTLTIPNENGPHSVVVLIHGSGPNDRDETIGPNKVFKDVAWGLASQGIAVLRYEKRTREHGLKMSSQLETLTPKEEVTDDALAAVTLLKSTPEIDPSRIYVLGHSLGGTLAPQIGKEDPDIAGLIILAGTSRPFEDVILNQYQYLAALDGQVTAEEEKELEKIQIQVARVKDPELSPDTPAAQMPLGMPAPYWLYLRDYSPAQTAGSLAIPMLILQGERDYQVTMEDFAGWRHLSSRTEIQFKSYQSLNHLFIPGEGPGNPTEYMQPGNVSQEVVDDIANWLLFR
jgi:hypothetical protein